MQARRRNKMATDPVARGLWPDSEGVLLFEEMDIIYIAVQRDGMGHGSGRRIIGEDTRLVHAEG